MKEWDRRGINSQKLHWGHRKDDPRSLYFYAGNAQFLQTFLRDDCDCKLGHRCDYHRKKHERTATNR